MGSLVLSQDRIIRKPSMNHSLVFFLKIEAETSSTQNDINHNIKISSKTRCDSLKADYFQLSESQSTRKLLWLVMLSRAVNSQSFRKINNIKINIVIHMEEQTYLTQQHANINGHPFSRLFLETSQLPSQKCVLDYNFNYDPFSYYHPYWGLQNHFYFNKQYLIAALYFCYNYEHQEQPKMENEQLRGSQDNNVLLSNSFKGNSQPEEEGENKNSDLKKKQPKRKYKTQKSKRRNQASSYWILEENKRYANFLSKNMELFSLSLVQKKKLKVNVKMSKKVRSRSPQQCHSHHQKMMKKHGSIICIIQSLQLQHRQLQKTVPNKEQPNRVQIQAEAFSDIKC